jgi:hypothetical protein
MGYMADAVGPIPLLGMRPITKPWTEGAEASNPYKTQLASPYGQARVNPRQKADKTRPTPVLESEMDRKILFSGILLVAIASLALGYLALQKGKPREVTFEQLSASPNRYRGRNIVIEGFYFQGWEVIVLCERLEQSGYAEGHLAPGGLTIWVEGGVPQDVYESLHSQAMMGPEERFGKVRVQGRDEQSGEYGHLGGFSSQIVPSEVELLQWSP